MKKYKLIVYIGRFQPFHNGHYKCIEAALDAAEHVLVLAGSDQASRSIKNPWTTKERRQMIAGSFKSACLAGCLSIQGLVDHTYNDDKWFQQVQDLVYKYAQTYNIDESEIALLTHFKDESSYYLNCFEMWNQFCVDTFRIGNERSLDATHLREFIFQDKSGLFQSVIPESTSKFLKDFHGTPALLNLVAEYKHVVDYQKQFSALPYPPTFNTADACVTQSGHVLMVRRNGFPGRGLWALPGGFLDPNETLEECMLRELTEETAIKIQYDTLKRCIVSQKTFDKPDRSVRGRTISEGFHIKLQDGKELPKVCIVDRNEAMQVRWVSFCDLSRMRNQTFEDHWHQVNYFIGLN